MACRFSASSGLLCLVCRPCRGGFTVQSTTPNRAQPRLSVGVAGYPTLVPTPSAVAPRSYASRAPCLAISRAVARALRRWKVATATRCSSRGVWGCRSQRPRAGLASGCSAARSVGRGLDESSGPGRGERGVRGAVGGRVVDREHRRTPRLGTDAAAFVHGHAVRRGPLYSTVERRSYDARDHAGSPVPPSCFRFKMSFPEARKSNHHAIPPPG